MVLESLTNPLKAKNHPARLFLLGVIYASAGLLLGNWIFREHASLIMVFLTVMACLPLLYTTMKEEEQEDIKIKTERGMLKEHSKVIVFFTFLFLGLVIGYTFWYVFGDYIFHLLSKISLFKGVTIQNTFEIQTTTIQAINAKIAGNYLSTKTLTHIILNNMKVLIFCILFSFLYGAGAIFILTWNASVISAAIGNFIRTNLTSIAANAGFAKVAGYFQIISLGLLRYLLHGIPEITAYFVGAIAGGIISVATIREKFGTKNFEKVVLDSANLILISIAILIIAAFIEVFITPALI